MSRHRRRGTAGVITLLAAASLAAAACSSGSSSSSTGSTMATGGPTPPSVGSAGTATGSVIKLGIIADVGTAVNYADGVSGAMSAVRGINARGGIDGHQVQLVFCNGALNPNTDASCVRQMISDKVMAMVGTEYVSYEESGDKAFQAAGIANVAAITYGYGASDPNSYLLESGQQFLNAAQALEAVKYLGKRVSLLRVDIPTTVPFVPALQKEMPLISGTYAGQVATPETESVDFGPTAATLMQGKPDAVTTDATEGADAGVLSAMAQVGFTGGEVLSADAFSLSTIKSLSTTLQDKLYFVGNFPPVSTASTIPGMAQFKKDMAAEVASGDKGDADYLTYNRAVVFNDYFGVIAIQQIADAAHATTAAAFETAIKAAKNVNLGGVIPAWTPNKSLSSVEPRSSNGDIYFSRWEDGTVKLLSTKPVDVTSLVNSSNS